MGEADSVPFFDEARVPVETIELPDPQIEGLSAGSVRSHQPEGELSPGAATRQLRHPQVSALGDQASRYPGDQLRACPGRVSSMAAARM